MDFDQSDFGFAAYMMKWNISGTPVVVDPTCENCEFLFDVTGTVDPAVSTESYDYFNTVYGYSSDFDGNGEAWVRGYYGSYYWWGYATLTDVGPVANTNYRFTYWYGYIDQPVTYGGVSGYYTYYQLGNVMVERSP
jgi:hypothetical protein